MRKMLALAALAGLALPGAGRADRLDSRLLEEAPRLVEKLKAKKYDNVGVLRFQVEMPGKKPSYTAPLSGNLVSRLETGLIIHVDQEGRPAMGVIRDAGGTAGRQNVGSWTASPTQRRKLFAGTYPLAWGRSKVKADVFLTGTVVVSKDLKKTTLTVLAFDKDAPAKMNTLASFTIPTDRHILRELGLSFASRSIKRKTDSEVDSEIIEEVQQQVNDNPKDKGKEDPPKDKDKGKDNPDKPKAQNIKPDNIGGVKIRMLSGGENVAFREKATQGDGIKWEAESPEAGKALVFELTNNGKKRVGVVLKVNGLNIVNMQKDDAEQCGKIILEPGWTRKVKGFIEVEDGVLPRAVKPKGGDDDDLGGDEPKKDDPPKGDDPPKKSKITLRPFNILVGEEAKKVAAELGDKAGLIEVDVFVEGDTQRPPDISPRGLPPSKDKVARETYKGLRTALLQASGLKTKVEDKGSGVRARTIVPKTAEEREDYAARVKAFPNPAFVARVAIRIVPKEVDP
jgi:hypothetical protein